MKIKIILFFILLSASANAQYNFPFTSRYASAHLIVNTNLKKIFDADAKRLRENKVKSVTVSGDNEEFEKYELNSRGFIENLITHNELFSGEENETEYNIKYNIGGLISYIFYSPEQTALFYEHDFGKLSQIKSESYEAIVFLARYYYKDELPDSLYTEFADGDFRRSTRFKIETDDNRLIKKITDVTIPNPEVVFEVNMDDKSMTVKAPDVKEDLSSYYMPARTDYDNQKYMKFIFDGDKISAYTTLKKINNALYIFTMAFSYQANGLIDGVSITKTSPDKKSATKSYKYKYEFFE